MRSDYEERRRVMGGKNEDKKYFIKTWGCQMNVHNSEKIAGVLSLLGYNAVDNEKEADLIIYNTCCVREHAEVKVYGNLGRLKKLKEQKRT